VAAIGARVLLLVARFLGRDRAAQLTLMMAIVWIVFESAHSLRLSPLLALLACGAFVRTFDRQRRFSGQDFGLISALALLLFFALSAATINLDVLLKAGLPALALVLARTLCKVATVGLLAPVTGIAWRKGLLIGLGLLPMSAISLMLSQTVTQFDPELDAQAGAVLLASVIIFQIVGTLALAFSLRTSGESRTEP
jgi:Kef-type K+ transport system membrane component KefB